MFSSLGAYLGGHGLLPDLNIATIHHELELPSRQIRNSESKRLDAKRYNFIRKVLAQGCGILWAEEVAPVNMLHTDETCIMYISPPGSTQHMQTSNS